VRSTLAVLTSLTRDAPSISTRASSLRHNCLSIRDTSHIQNHSHESRITPSIWRRTSGQQFPPLPRHDHHNHLRPRCPSPHPLQASPHSSALTRRHYEVCLPPNLSFSSLTNHKPADRFPSHIAQHNRRLDSTKPKCATNACTTRVRPDINEYETAERTWTHVTARAMRPI
jgi:hypothetical protein